MTDETIFVVAHRDGWFEAANDNGTGMATAIGLADFFARVPREQRPRTITFLGTSGHHNNGSRSGTWLAQHPEVFENAALLLNCEHTGVRQTGVASTQFSNAPGVSSWYAGGPELAKIVNDVNALSLDDFRRP